MHFIIDEDLLNHTRAALAGRKRLVWVVGAAASGKTTVCQALAACFDIPLVDMDAHIYGDYHGRFSPARHPVNTMWSASPNGLAWLLGMTCDEFDSFNHAALPEYLDLLAGDLAVIPREDALIVDGGISAPALLARAIPPGQIVCVAQRNRDSRHIWEQIEARRAMKDEVFRLPAPEDAWRRFIEFDERMAETILDECRQSGIAICIRDAATPVEALAGQVARVAGLEPAR